MTRSQPEIHAEYHKDGSIRARGRRRQETPVGYWEWFRKDGTRLRSGSFDDDGNQVGLWTTYDAEGAAYKVTDMDRKRGSRTSAAGRAMGSRD